MEIIGYIGALVMGISLGLIGGGGSILTVPILVYLFGINTVLATAYSLFIVGLTSLFGAISHLRQGNVHWLTVLVFGLPSVAGVYLTRHYLLPSLPESVSVMGLLLTKSVGLLLLFAFVMLLASYSMIRPEPAFVAGNRSVREVSYHYPLILGEGLLVGGITGLVGAGGGFLIIPALVLLAKLPMKQAVGTSLVVIAFKSLLGFTADLHHAVWIDWHFLGWFSGIATLGILVGSGLSGRVSNETLKPLFGWFVLAMGIYIMVKELYF